MSRKNKRWLLWGGVAVAAWLALGRPKAKMTG